MPKKIINTLLLASGLCFFACHKDKEVKIPDGILNKEKFAKVLADFALAESAATMNIKNVALYKIDSAYAFNPLKENKITKGRYDSTVAFYAEHSELYKEIYENALTILSAMQTYRDSVKTHMPKPDTAKIHDAAKTASTAAQPLGKKPNP